eukprot:m.25723 g.25723  ORF g.25723 m.25723 type:complete len:900 (-) comp7734_c0_seq3:2011-4710(-)
MIGVFLVVAIAISSSYGEHVYTRNQLKLRKVVPSSGTGVQPLGCDSSSVFQQWSREGPRLFINVPSSDGQGMVKMCLQVGLDDVLFTMPCNASEPLQNFTLATDPSVSMNGFLLKSLNGQCIAVQGCCDPGPLSLVDCSQCTNTGRSPDCFLNYSNSSGTLKTIVSGLCFDGGTPLPPRGCMQPGSTKTLPFCNTKLSNAARATDLVSRMTLVEKVTGVLSMIMVPLYFLNGTKVNYNLRQTSGVPRLGVPPIKYNEALHGIEALCLSSGKCPTMFPETIGMAASFNSTLWQAVGNSLGHEGRALYNAGLDAGSFWAPDVNPFRDPRYGRGMETAGEDAYVNARYAQSYVTAIQGSKGGADAGSLLSSTACKHILLYDSQTPYPSAHSVNVSIRDLNDYYLKPWTQGCAPASAASMMCSYGAFNGVPDCANKEMLADKLKKMWPGFIVSDCDAVAGVYSSHKFAPNATSGVAAAINAGVDLDCGPTYLDYLVPAVEEGLVEEATVTAAAIRVLTAQFAIGFFDNESEFSNITLNEVGSQAHIDLAREASQQSITLLKNNGLLPLNKGSKVAFIGPHANSTIDLLGNYAMFDNKRVLQNSPLMAAQRRSLQISYAPGCSSLQCNTSDFSAAIDAAREASAAVVFLGISDDFEGEGRDRKSLELPGQQVELALAIIAAQPQTAVVVIHGGMVILDDLVYGKNDSASANSILSAFYPGQEGGEAIVDILFGNVHPTGKLPYTWYKRGFEMERGAMDNQDLRSDQGITYRYYKGKPLFPFGWGLTYNSFEFSWHQEPPKTITISELNEKGLELHVDVSSKLGGQTTLLTFAIYESDECPTRSLVAFDRVVVPPASSATSIQNVQGNEFKCVDNSGKAFIPVGMLKLSSGDLNNPVTFTITIKD